METDLDMDISEDDTTKYDGDMEIYETLDDPEETNISE